MNVRVVPFQPSECVDDARMVCFGGMPLRYRVVDAATGEVLDDALGRGYESSYKAHAAWAYKNRDTSRDAENLAVWDWLYAHEAFNEALEAAYLAAASGEGARLDAALAGSMLRERGVECPFSPDVLVFHWHKGNVASLSRRGGKKSKIC